MAKWVYASAFVPVAARFDLEATLDFFALASKAGHGD
jgi:hypothetical protein